MYIHKIADWCRCGSFASPLRGSQVIATDLRGGMSLILAGLAAEGITEISGISHVDRGYESLEMKLQGLGANVIRMTSW